MHSTASTSTFTSSLNLSSTPPSSTSFSNSDLLANENARFHFIYEHDLNGDQIESFGGLIPTPSFEHCGWAITGQELLQIIFDVTQDCTTEALDSVKNDETSSTTENFTPEASTDKSSSVPSLSFPVEEFSDDDDDDNTKDELSQLIDDEIYHKSNNTASPTLIHNVSEFLDGYVEADVRKKIRKSLRVEPETLNEILGRHFVVTENKREGDCTFYAIIDAIGSVGVQLDEEYSLRTGSTEEKMLKLRNKFVEFALKLLHEEGDVFFKRFFEDTDWSEQWMEKEIKKFLTPTHWASAVGDHVVRVLARSISRHIWIFNNNGVGWLKVDGGSTADAQQPIFLLYRDESHYEALIPRDIRLLPTNLNEIIIKRSEFQNKEKSDSQAELNYNSSKMSFLFSATIERPPKSDQSSTTRTSNKSTIGSEAKSKKALTSSDGTLTHPIRINKFSDFLAISRSFTQSGSSDRHALIAINEFHVRVNERDAYLNYGREAECLEKAVSVITEKVYKEVIEPSQSAESRHVHMILFILGLSIFYWLSNQLHKTMKLQKGPSYLTLHDSLTKHLHSKNINDYSAVQISRDFLSVSRAHLDYSAVISSNISKVDGSLLIQYITGLVSNRDSMRGASKHVVNYLCDQLLPIDCICPIRLSTAIVVLSEGSRFAPSLLCFLQLLDLIESKSIDPIDDQMYTFRSIFYSENEVATKGRLISNQTRCMLMGKHPMCHQGSFVEIHKKHNLHSFENPPRDIDGRTCLSTVLLKTINVCSSWLRLKLANKKYFASQDDMKGFIRNSIKERLGSASNK